MTCSSWPEATEWGCSNGGGWTGLDSSMGISQTAECELLCRQQNSDGCCYLSDSHGCYWRISSEAGVGEQVPQVPGLAVTCVMPGILFLN